MSNVAGESFGINDECYKVSKPVLLDFFNTELQLSITKIEQLGTGSVYCQIIDKIFPGTFNIGAVKWGAKFDYEFVENYKILNNAFRKNGIQKNLEVDKLVKCRLLDNTEMCQWIRKYFELHYSGQEYDPVARRGGQDLHYILGGGKVGPVKKVTTSEPSNRPATASNKPRPAASGSAVSNKFGAKSGGDTAKLEEQVAELSSNNQILDKEREFYFGKLRLIEEMIQKNGLEAHPLGDTVLKILYAGEDEDIDVTAEGNVVINSGGQTIVHKVDMAAVKGYNTDNKGEDAMQE